MSQDPQPNKEINQDLQPAEGKHGAEEETNQNVGLINQDLSDTEDESKGKELVRDENNPSTSKPVESSDIEILQEDSSDSIEVLDPEKNADRNSINTLTAGLEGSGEVSPMKAQPSTSSASAVPVAASADLMQRLLGDLHSAPTRYENIYDSSDYPSADEEEVCINRPDSLCLPRPLQYYEKRKKVGRGMSESSMSTSSSVDALIEEVSKTPLSLQGTVSMNDDKMMEFVVSDLSHMIKMSSPMSQSSGSPRSVSSSTSGWSSSSASGWSYSGISRSPSVLTASPEDVPPVDPRALMDLEQQATNVAESLDHMMGTLTNNLHKMSALTYSCLSSYAEGVDNTCDSVDTSIKSMYKLMAKCEELSTSMQPVYKLHSQVVDISRLVSQLEDLAKQEPGTVRKSTAASSSSTSA